ncbi:MAG: hypothetical protein ACKVOU_01175 [Cytophagales bacterium]
MKSHNYLLSATFMLAMLLMIYFRSKIESWFALQFETVKEFSPEKYPTDIAEVSKLWAQSYKWAFTLSFTILFSLASLGCIFSLFPFGQVLRSIFAIFSIIFILIVFFSMLSLFTHNYTLGFGVVLYLKKLLHTPYLTLFFILYYWKINNPYAPKQD